MGMATANKLKIGSLAPDFKNLPGVDGNQRSLSDYAGKKVLVVFQPHLYSRTRDFVEEFAESLSKFDELLLLDIYPARELPIEGVTSNWLLNKIENKKYISNSGR